MARAVMSEQSGAEWFSTIATFGIRRLKEARLVPSAVDPVGPRRIVSRAGKSLFKTIVMPPGITSRSAMCYWILRHDRSSTMIP